MRAILIISSQCGILLKESAQTNNTEHCPRAFRVAESRKCRKFAQLLSAAQEHLAGEAQVQFLTFGFSTQGTLSPGAGETIKCLKEAYGKKCEGELAPRDGAPMKYRMAKFEADTRDEIAAAIARGVEEMHAIAGGPDLQGWRCSRADEMARVGG
jgi:hypothetical protein